MTTSPEEKMMSSPLESGFNTRDWPVILRDPEVIQMGTERNQYREVGIQVVISKARRAANDSRRDGRLSLLIC